MAELINLNIESRKYNYLRLMPFYKVLLWDVKRFSKNEMISKYNVDKLVNHINQENLKIKPFEFPEEDFKILGVNNKTGIYDAYIEKGKNINQPYKLVKNGFLAYNPYRINVGSIGLKTKEHKYEYISPAYVVFSCKDTLLPEYLFVLLKTERYNEVIKENTTGSVRQNLTYDNLKTFDIPVPSIEKQNGMLNKYHSKINLAETQEQRAKELEEEIDNYLLKTLEIQKIIDSDFNKGINFLSFRNIKEWGVDKILRGHQDSLLRSVKYENVELSKVVLINPRTDLTELKNDDKMSFIPMECVSDDYGEVSYLKEGVKKLSKGYTKFQESDLIWARITPCMENGKSAIIKELINKKGYGSTEFHVIRSLSQNVLLDYIYHLLRMKLVRKDAVNHFTGSAGQQRVPKTYLENLTIPLPPLKIQTKVNEYINHMKNEIKLLRNTSEANRIDAVKEFEEEIFN